MFVAFALSMLIIVLLLAFPRFWLWCSSHVPYADTNLFEMWQWTMIKMLDGEPLLSNHNFDSQLARWTAWYRVMLRVDPEAAWGQFVAFMSQDARQNEDKVTAAEQKQAAGDDDVC